MRKRCRHVLFFSPVIAALAITITGCESMGGEIAGSFYNVQLKESVPQSACIDLAHQMAAELPLHVVDEVYPPRPKGQCIVDLRSVNLVDELGVTILSSPTENRLALQFRQLRHGHMNADTPTGTYAQLTAQAVALTQKRLPDAVITATHPHYSLLGP